MLSPTNRGKSIIKCRNLSMSSTYAGLSFIQVLLKQVLLTEFNKMYYNHIHNTSVLIMTDLYLIIYSLLRVSILNDTKF